LGADGVVVSDGRYALDLTARDAAGNVSAGLGVPVVVATARGGVAAVPAWISPAGRGPDPRMSTLSFALARPASVTWRVVTEAGTPVRTWYVDALLDAGIQSVRWDGRDDTGALVPGGRYLSQVTVSEGDTSTTEQAWVYSDGIRILVSDTTPAAGQVVTITVAAVEALGANPTVWATQPGRARIGYPTVKVGTSTYRVQLRLRTGRAGTLTIAVSGVDRFGRPATSSVGYRLH
jgi:hypothetical protein